jgi:hypothetical protein
MSYTPSSSPAIEKSSLWQCEQALRPLNHGAVEALEPSQALMDLDSVNIHNCVFNINTVISNTCPVHEVIKLHTKIEDDTWSDDATLVQILIADNFSLLYSPSEKTNPIINARLTHFIRS